MKKLDTFKALMTSLGFDLAYCLDCQPCCCAIPPGFFASHGQDCHNRHDRFQKRVEGVQNALWMLGLDPKVVAYRLYILNRVENNRILYDSSRGFGGCCMPLDFIKIIAELLDQPDLVRTIAQIIEEHEKSQRHP